MKILGVIPARFNSSRFPGKPLADIEGWPMIRHVYERSKNAKSLSSLIVATDDQSIYDAVVHFGGNVIMTSDQHPTGTDRIIEVMEKMQEYDAYINIQGDEPKIHSQQIDQVGEILQSHSGIFVGTLVKRTKNAEEYHSPNTIKAVLDHEGKALYFSRFSIPYLRDTQTASEWVNANGYYKHIGIYGYSKSALEKIKTLQQSILEKAESLEQLRWMENGIPVFARETEFESFSVDVPEDLRKFGT